MTFTEKIEKTERMNKYDYLLSSGYTYLGTKEINNGKYLLDRYQYVASYIPYVLLDEFILIYSDK